jgi:hypothetical protein
MFNSLPLLCFIITYCNFIHQPHTGVCVTCEDIFYTNWQYCATESNDSSLTPSRMAVGIPNLMVTRKVMMLIGPMVSPGNSVLNKEIEATRAVDISRAITVHIIINNVYPVFLFIFLMVFLVHFLLYL